VYSFLMCSLVPLCQKCTVFDILQFKNALSVKSGLWVRQIHIKINVIVWYGAYNFILMFYSNYSSIYFCFWDIQCLKTSWPFNPSQTSLKVMGTDTYRSATHDFLLTFHSNHQPISHRFQDKWRYPLKFANFTTPMY